MQNRYSLVILLLVLFSLLSCNTDNDTYKGPSIDFGVAKYYEPFLFSKSDTLILYKTLNFDFNDYAKENASHINISLVDKEERIISNENVRFLIDNIHVPTNEFSIQSSEQQKGRIEVGIQFSPNYPSGLHSGFLQISSHSLDVVNNYDLNISDETRVFEWVARQKVVMNPLKKALIWTGGILVALLLIWLIFLRPIVYSRFGRGILTIQSPQFKSIKLYKAIGLTLTNQDINQSWKEKLFKGKEIAYTNPLFPAPIRFSPQSKNRIRIHLDASYSITPFATTLTKGQGQHTIINLNTKQKIIITYT